MTQETPVLDVRLRQAVRPVSIIESVKLNAILGIPCILASETFQHTGSFKFRAAYNTALHSPHRHLATASSGNFGQALAYACKLLGKSCTVVMPNNSSTAKVDAVRSFGGLVELVDVGAKTRETWLKEVVQDLVDVEIVSPFDDERVIEGNSSIADEIIDRIDGFDCVVVPIGGGGLSSGVIRGFQRRGVEVEILGAEPALGNDASRSLREGELLKNSTEPQTIADGARTISLGKLNWPILESGITKIFEVNEDTIEEAVRMLFLYANLKVEPTGALTTGAVLSNRSYFQDKRPVLIISGGNVDPNVYARLLSATDNKS